MQTLLALLFVAGSDPKAIKQDFDKESCLYSQDLSAMLCMVRIPQADKSFRYRLELRDSSRMDPQTHWHVILAKHDVATSGDEQLEQMGANAAPYSAFALAADAFVIPVTVVGKEVHREVLLVVKKNGEQLSVDEGWKSPACTGACRIGFYTSTSAPPKREKIIVVDLQGGTPAQKLQLIWQNGKLIQK